MNTTTLLSPRLWMFIACVGICFGLTAAAARAEDEAACPLKFPEEFKAKMNSTMTSAGAGQAQPPQVMTSTLYVRKDALRMEGTDQSALMLGKEQKNYLLNHDLKHYAEGPFSREGLDIFSGKMPPGVVWNKEVTEEVNGTKCDRYNVTVPAMGPMNTTIQVWLDVEKHWPVQVVTNMTSADPGMNFSMNVRATIAITEGAQKPEYFELPKDYNLVDMPAFVHGGTPLQEKDPQ
ncbi:MAG: hypothetical protein ACAI35_03615 [Candidatus Methylacidiphilales bacterium]|nr:hypothetical protein [Candidatus Methylacidiphilales bacterium]